MAIAAAQQGREEMQKAVLNAVRNRKIREQFRSNLIQEQENSDEDNDAPEESKQRSRLALLKAGAIKQANAKAGEAVGAAVGGALGSAVPILGTGVGGFLGRYIGKKIGITKMILLSILGLSFSALLSTIIFLAAMKGYCGTFTTVDQAVDYFTLNICSNFQ